MHSRIDRTYLYEMHHRSMHQINEVLHVYLHTSREEKWKCLKREKQLELYVKKFPMSRSVVFVGVNEIHCNFDDVFDVFNYETTSRFQLIMKLLYDRNFRDGVLMTKEVPRQYDEQYGVSNVQHSTMWCTFQDGRQSLVGREQLHTFFQASMMIYPEQNAGPRFFNTHATSKPMTPIYGRPSEIIQKRTMALAWLPFSQPQFNHSLPIQYTLIIEEVSRNRLQVRCVAACYHDGDILSSSSSSIWKLARRFVHRTVLKLEQTVITSRMSTQALVSRHQWVRDEDRASCVICWKLFNTVYRRRHHCRLCGEVICGSCSSLREIGGSRVLGKSIVNKVRFCHLCSNRGTRQDSFASLSTLSLHSGALGQPSQSAFPFGSQIQAKSGVRTQIGQHTGMTSGSYFNRDEDSMRDTFASGYMGTYEMNSTLYNIGSRAKVISIKSMSSQGSAFRSQPSSVSSITWSPPSTGLTSSRSRSISIREKQLADEDISHSFLHPAAIKSNTSLGQSIVADVGSFETPRQDKVMSFPKTSSSEGNKVKSQTERASTKSIEGY